MKQRTLSSMAAHILAVTLILAVPSTHAIAEPGPIGRWLMNTPSTLWDRGMDNIAEATKIASDHTVKWAEIKYSVKYSEVMKFAFVVYDWENNEINIIMHLRVPSNKMSHENCNKVRRTFISGFTIASLSDGEFRERDEKITRIMLKQRIDGWFSHYGFVLKNRDEELAEKMSRIIFVKVGLLNKDEYKGEFSCRDRIMTFDAPSKPAFKESGS